jgi:hypothetical protein
MFFGAPHHGALFPFQFSPMETRRLRRFLRKYYLKQSDIRPKWRPVVRQSMPGIAFDICVVALFIIMGLVNLF